VPDDLRLVRSAPDAIRSESLVGESSSALTCTWNTGAASLGQALDALGLPE
jgi:hypothetical protein